MRVIGRLSELIARLRASAGEPKIIAAILKPTVIERILAHLGLKARAQPRTGSCSTLNRPRRMQGRAKQNCGGELKTIAAIPGQRTKPLAR